MRMQRIKEEVRPRDAEIRNAATINDSQLQELAASHSDMECLRIGDNRTVTPAALLRIAQGTPRLKNLCLRGTLATDEVVNAFISHCPDLERIDLGDCLALERINGLSTRIHIRELRLPRCDKAVTAELVASLRGCRKLEVLDLSFCTAVTDQALQELSAGCRALTWVSLAGCKQLSDAGLMALAGSNPGIKHLNLALNRQMSLTDDGVANAVRVLRRLRSFDATGCTHLHTKMPRSLAKNCEWVEELSLASCTDMCDDELRALLAGCQRLESLDLTGCQSLTEANLLEVIPASPKLRRLVVNLVPDLSESGLATLRRLVPECVIERHARQKEDPTNLFLYLGDIARPPRIKAKKKKKKNKEGSSTGKPKR